jgi:Bacterial conjugation TrbI-like protein
MRRALTALLLVLSAPAVAQTGDPTAQLEQLRTALQSLGSQLQNGARTLPGNTLQPGPGLQSPFAAALPAPDVLQPPKVSDILSEPALLRPPAEPGHTDQNGSGTQRLPAFTGPSSKVPIGYVATGTLTMTINSDYPGPWRGQLTQPIYSIDNREVLFPEGTVIVGRTVRVGGPNEAINDRLGLLPTYLVRADGTPFKINQQAILDELGIAGIPGDVDYHIGVQLAAIGAFVGVQALPNVVSAQGGAAPVTTNNQPVPAFVNQTSQAGDTILQRYLTLVPTVTVHSGTPIRIFFQDELLAPDLRPRDRFELTNIAASAPKEAKR